METTEYRVDYFNDGTTGVTAQSSAITISITADNASITNSDIITDIEHKRLIDERPSELAMLQEQAEITKNNNNGRNNQQ